MRRKGLVDNRLSLPVLWTVCLDESLDGSKGSFAGDSKVEKAWDMACAPSDLICLRQNTISSVVGYGFWACIKCHFLRFVNRDIYRRLISS